jgi:hypothetical protein
MAKVEFTTDEWNALAYAIKARLLSFEQGITYKNRDTLFNDPEYIALMSVVRKLGID